MSLMDMHNRENKKGLALTPHDFDLEKGRAEGIGLEWRGYRE